MRILAIETSCDETAAAVVEDGRRVLSNVIASQVRRHERYRGVVPELASRAHIDYLLPVVEQALEAAGSDPAGRGIDSLAVTRGPGLVGALLVGVETAKTLALAWQKPLIPVNHLLGHLHALFCEMPGGGSRVLHIEPDEDDGTVGEWTRPRPDSERSERAAGEDFDYPFLGLIVSGGHSNLVRVDGPAELRSLGSTLDDAPGEAYDKVAKLLGLPYPGGPEVDMRALRGNPEAFALPRPILHSHAFDFSFSGLKTAVVQTVESLGGPAALRESETALNDLCASFQAAVIDVLLTKSERALQAERLTRLAIVGGVACNKGLRGEAARRRRRTHLAFPPPILCTDNAAQIGAAAHHLPPADETEAPALDARAGWPL